MLIGDPLGEESNASSTDNELWRADNSFLIMLKRERHAHRRPSKVRGAMLARPIRSPEGSAMPIGDPLGEGSNASSTYNAQKGAASS